MQDEPRRWFGFSPVVIAVAVVVLLAGGLAFKKTRHSGYDAQILQMCDDGEQYLKASSSSDNPFPPLHELAEAHRRTLSSITPPPERLEFHSYLLLVERSVSEAAAAGNRLYSRYGADGARASEAIAAQASHSADVIYEQEFGRSGCSVTNEFEAIATHPVSGLMDGPPTP